jgi:hypothetical protein
MKTLLFSILPLTLVSAGVIQQRQSASLGPLGGLLDLLKKTNGTLNESGVLKVLPKATLVKMEQREPQLRKTAKRHIARYGPYVLAGKNVSFLFRTK